LRSERSPICNRRDKLDARASSARLLILPCDPLAQGKIERRRQRLKNRSKTILAGGPEPKIAAFVDQYDHRRYRESLNKLASADICIECGTKIPREQKRIEWIMIKNRRFIDALPPLKLDADEPRPPQHPSVSNQSTTENHRTCAISDRDR
jgi:hypothetical protein